MLYVASIDYTNEYVGKNYKEAKRTLFKKKKARIGTIEQWKNGKHFLTEHFFIKGE